MGLSIVRVVTYRNLSNIPPIADKALSFGFQKKIALNLSDLWFSILTWKQVTGRTQQEYRSSPGFRDKRSSTEQTTASGCLAICS